MPLRIAILEYHGTYTCTSTYTYTCAGCTNLVHVQSIPWYSTIPYQWYQWYGTNGTYMCTYKHQKRQASKHTGATGKPPMVVGVVSIEDITVYYSSNSTAMSAARISTTILASMSAPAPASPSCRTRLRVPRVVVLAGHLLAWLESRQSVEPVTGRFVDTTTCLSRMCTPWYTCTTLVPVWYHLPWYTNRVPVVGIAYTRTYTCTIWHTCTCGMLLRLPHFKLIMAYHW